MQNKRKKIDLLMHEKDENMNTNYMEQPQIIESEELFKELHKYKKFDYYLEITYDIIIYCGNKIIKFVKFIIKISGVYLMWILLHYIASQLYVKFCTPSDIMGFIMSPFLISTPHCQGLRWLIYNGANMINNMWVMIGAWLCAHLFILNNNTPTNQSTE
jgi:hypothetical protein